MQKFSHLSPLPSVFSYLLGNSHQQQKKCVAIFKKTPMIPSLLFTTYFSAPLQQDSLKELSKIAVSKSSSLSLSLPHQARFLLLKNSKNTAVFKVINTSTLLNPTINSQSSCYLIYQKDLTQMVCPLK